MAFLLCSIPSEWGGPCTAFCRRSYERKAGAQFLANRISLVKSFLVRRLAGLGLCTPYSFSLLSSWTASFQNWSLQALLLLMLKRSTLLDVTHRLLCSCSESGIGLPLVTLEHYYSSLPSLFSYKCHFLIPLLTPAWPWLIFGNHSSLGFEPLWVSIEVELHFCFTLLTVVGRWFLRNDSEQTFKSYLNIKS